MPNGVQKCREHMEDLVRCIRATECGRQPGVSSSECLRKRLVPECDGLKEAYSRCRRDMLNMRTRIRGSKAS